LRFLLDTHFAFWLALNPAALTATEMKLLSDPTNDIAVSTVSLWELRIKWEKRFVSGERKGEARPVDVLQALRARNVPIEPILPEHAVATLNPIATNKDPFDEQLLVHAQELGMILMTRDSMLRGHPLVFTP
jgi:PIN domain nuclease of toxin-antitoxin system